MENQLMLINVDLILINTDYCNSDLMVTKKLAIHQVDICFFLDGEDILLVR